MFISKICLENFRNFQSLDLSIDRGFVVLAGKNGAGKTNFLEGIYQGATLRRFSDSSFHQLFRDETDYFRITLSFVGEEETELLVVSQKTEKLYRHKLSVNGTDTPRTKYAGNLPVVSFLPQDLNLLTRSPGGRRNYLDETLSLVSLEYRHALSQYKKTLRQRNDLLKSISEGRGGETALPVWNENLAEHGSVVTGERERFLSFLNKHASEVLSTLSESTREIHFTYKNSGERDKQAYLAKIATVQGKEKIIGTTLLGPHRDDFETRVSEKVAKGYASRGQMRTITLLLKMLEQEYVKERLGKRPVLLLDDVFSEFDSDHQQKLVEFLKEQEQVFLTTAHLEEIEHYLPDTAQVFEVDNGNIKVATELTHELAQ